MGEARETGEVLLIVEGDDPGAVMLGAAFRRHGWRLRLLDLRFHRPTLDGVDEPPTVWLDGTSIRPDVVVNRTATTRLGLAAASALARQLASTWSARHLAAREEQGLLLACLDLWERTSRLYNPVRTLDRRLLRPAVEAELRAAGLPVGAADDGEAGGKGEGRPGVCWIVDGTIVAAASLGRDKRWSATPLSAETGETITRMATMTGLRLGQIDLWQPRSDPGATTITGWRPIPLFRAFWEHTGTDVAALVVAAIVGEPPMAAPGFLAADLEPNLLDFKAQSRRR
ncbi:MAG TPA: hypothetical protein VGO78_23055 [Acidimicrobiales bacterium]|nr:hypothetical protein [Acidimicrobiales bacterium]